MLIDLHDHRRIEATDHDVCIVGAGAAGIVLARELSGFGLRVLLLEAGGRRFESAAHALYQGESTGVPFTGLLEGRFRGLGGTTTQWGGQILEIDDFIFRARPWVPKSGWPFEKPELDAHYRRSLELAGLEKALADPQALWKALGLSPPELGSDLVSAFSRWCPQTDFAKLHRPTLTRDERVTVLLHANVCELLLAPDRSALEALVCRTLDGRTFRFSARNFVLAIGGIETSRLLLQPQRDGTPAPWHLHGQVGRHFQEHLVCDVGRIEPTHWDAVVGRFDYVSSAGFRYHPKMKLAPSAQRRLETLDLCGTVSFEQNGVDHLAKAFETFRMARRRQFGRISPERAAHFVAHLPQMAWHKFPYARRASGSTERAGTSLRLKVHCEQSPDTAGHIALSGQRDALGLFKPAVNWKVGTLECASIRSYAQVFKQGFESRGLGRVEFDDGILTSDDVLIEHIDESYHHLGGARMSTLPQHGVVDEHLRLHGVANAYVCSSAVFPSAGFVNPTHTVMALALRLADRLRREHVHWTAARDRGGPAQGAGYQ